MSNPKPLSSESFSRTPWDTLSLATKFPSRATSWKLRSRTLHLGAIPQLMGIVNVTPDSFSDGGKYFDSHAAVEHALRLASEGASILDVGGESTRPYSQPISAEEEIRRVLPVIETLAKQTTLPISIDTSKSAVAQAALDAGAEIVNDVTGLEGDPKMVDVIRKYSPGICAMHMQGNPQTMQNAPNYDDVVGEITQYLSQRRDALLQMGIAPEHICLDPGIGFGKSTGHNMELLSGAANFHVLGCPILIGHSRKGFLQKVVGYEVADRKSLNLGVSLAMAVQGIQLLRVHDVLETVQALTLFAESGGIGCEG